MESELEGRRLGGRYLLESPIASGGMATVWRATDEVLGRSDAVKVLRQDLARDLDLLERFRLEAVAAARLSHPAVVRVFDTGVDDDVVYIVMELYEGTTLADILSDGPLRPEEAARIVGEALQGLAHAHREGVIHRDVKPSNILVDGSGLVKVTDFGIAKAAFAGGDVTTTGNLLGTAKYLAPEQVEGGSVDARADLYSTGIVLYEALTGRPPFEAQNHLATATMRLTKAPTPPGALRPGIPRPLEAVVLKALARRPEDRFQSAEEMSAAIDRATPSVRRPAPPIEVPREPSGGRPSSVFRSWMLVPLLLAVVAAFALVGFFVFGNVFEGGGGSQSTAGQVEPLRIVSVNDYDPLGDGAENGDAVGLATDGNPATSWTTEGYFQADLDKPGVGLLLDLGRQREVTEVRLRTNVPGWSFQVQAPESPGGLSDPLPDTEGTSDFVARNAMRIELQPATARYLLIWMTQGADSGDGRYRGDVAEVDLLGPRG